jgi:hypothetical protein
MKLITLNNLKLMAYFILENILLIEKDFNFNLLHDKKFI